MAERTKKRYVDTSKGCFNCFYRSFEPEAYPCSRCKRNAPSKDMWQPRVSQTEPIPKDKIIPDGYGNVLMSEDTYEELIDKSAEQTEPSMEREDE